MYHVSSCRRVRYIIGWITRARARSLAHSRVGALTVRNAVDYGYGMDATPISSYRSRLFAKCRSALTIRIIYLRNGPQNERQITVDIARLFIAANMLQRVCAHLPKSGAYSIGFCEPGLA